VSAAEKFSELLTIMSRLRSSEGCPWDREQDIHSLRVYLLEEVYELIDAMDDENWPVIKEELGDLLFHIVFQAQLAREKDEFTMADILEHISHKITSRHPHVFADGDKLTSPDQVENQWEKLKLREGKRSVLGGVPRSLSALVRAYRVQEKAASVGFQWDDIQGAVSKLDEEYGEFRERLEQGDREGMTEELGDFMFSMVNVSRYLKLSPEDALRGTVNKFMLRFQYIESKLAEQGSSPATATLTEMDALWNEAKQKSLTP
jgi:MazG family protein